MNSYEKAFNLIKDKIKKSVNKSFSYNYSFAFNTGYNPTDGSLYHQTTFYTINDLKIKEEKFYLSKMANATLDNNTGLLSFLYIEKIQDDPGPFGCPQYFDELVDHCVYITKYAASSEINKRKANKIKRLEQELKELKGK